MKKLFSLFWAASVFLGLLTVTGCGKDNSTAFADMGLDPDVEYADYEYIEPGNFFDLDYRGEIPEPESVPGKLDLSGKGGAEGSSTSVVPGLRDLKDYATDYRTKRLSKEEYLAAISRNAKEGRKITYVSKTESSEKESSPKEAAEEEKKSDEPPAEQGDLYVKDWGPQNSVPGEINKPVFYIEFSLPVRALTALDDQSKINADAKKLFTITPEIKGSYHWNGTKNLTFEADETLDPCISYELNVSSSIRSVGGKELTGNTTFKTKTAPARLVDYKPGVDKEHSYYDYSSDSGLPKENARHVKVMFNYMFTSDDVYSRIAIAVRSKSDPTWRELGYSAQGDFDSSNARLSLDKKKTNSFFLTINDPIENNSEIRISFNTGSKETKHTYKTLIPFEVTECKDYSGRGYGSAVRFTFNQPVSRDTFRAAFKCSTQTLSDDNFSFWCNEVTIQYLQLNPGEKSVVSVNSELKNVYGFNLTNPKQVSITGKDYQGYARYIDSGNVIMEAQFPHKLLFEYMNAERGAYRIARTDSPLESLDWNRKFQIGDYGSKYIDTSSKNTRQFVEIDLEPYLENGYGAVRFESDIRTKYVNWRGEDDSQSNSNYLNVQVTDLAATARFGINRAVVMVRSMEHNTPVVGAEVYLTSKSNYLHTAPALTNEDGLAEIELAPEDQATFSDWHDQSNVIVNVSAGADKVQFIPSTHSSWRDGVSTGSIYDALKPVHRVFMFCDRGVYKPGETITFKGIDRDQKLGSFISYNGGYSVVLEQRSWRGNTVYSTKEGVTSASGGFDGKFDLPESLKPGSYCLTYRRGFSTSSDEYRSLYFDVAYFEPLKFQAEAVITNKTAYAGDILNADIKASYLAGGSLSGAGFDATWYTEPAGFYPQRPELKKYTFGISDDYDYRRSISDEEGKLSSDGKVKLTCQTGDNLKGIPYRYRVETYITDVSNQRISAAAVKVVHPAFFYIGVGRPEGLRGFAKKGNTLKFPYVLAGADEFILDDTKYVSGDLSYELTREYWTYNYQNSVDGGVYARYEKHTDLEKTGTFSPSVKGTLSISPENAGWYTLRVRGSDSKGREAVTDYGFYVTGSGASWYDSSSSSDLRLTPDQSQYNPGDTAHILLESPLPAGDYLITVEREGIFTEEVRHFDESCNVIDVKIARNYVPVVYVSVSSYSVRSGAPVHEYGEKDMDKPKGYYGVTPLFINPRVRAFSVKAETDKKVYRPGETATVTLTATKAGKPVEGAELTVFAADRAVLDLINYHVPNPIDFFYSKYNFPLRVRGGDSRDYLMDPVTYSIKNLQGGDSSEEKDADERKDFRPTAFFEPQLITGPDGTVKCTFKVPDNLTTFRMTAFGVKEELLALQEEEFAVQNPVNVQSVQPRRLRERDTAECGVLITNLDNVPHEITVELGIRDPKQSKTDLSEGRKTLVGKAMVDGKSSYSVTVGAGSSSVVYFDVAATKEGFVELVYSVKSDILTEKLVSKIQIEKTYCMETVVLQGATEYADGNTKASKELIQIPGFAKDGVGSLKVTLDATQLGLLGSAVNYVFDYPYGCMEQQSSRIIPLVAFDKYIDIFGLDNRVADTRDVVKSYFAKWADVQHSNGGFPYWPSDSKYENFYVSVRIAHIYAMALSRGYTASELKINISNLKRYIKRNIDEKHTYDAAYACYAFALLGDSSLDGTLESLASKAESDLDLAAYLGLAWANKGTASGKEKAKKFLGIIRDYMRPDLRSVDITQPVNNGYCWYRNYTGQTARILQLYVTLDPTSEMVDRLLYSLLADQRNGYWQSTVTTAKVLEAIYTLIKERKLDTTDFVAKAQIMSNEIATANFKGVAAKPVDSTSDFSSSLMKSLPRDKNIDLTFSATGTGTLYYTAELKYALPDEMQNNRSEGIEVTYTLTDADTGKEISTKDMILALETGRTYNVCVKVTSSKNRDHVALRVPIPSGAEILDSTFVTSGSEASTRSHGGGWWWSAQYIYDNEIQYFWDDFDSGSRTVEFTMRTARRGVYPVTPILAECMYQPEVFGRSDGYLYTIK